MSNILTTDTAPEVVVPKANSSSPSNTSTTLRNAVREAMRNYLNQFANPPPDDLYEQILVDVEAPLLEIVLQYVGQNQCKAAKLLAVSRGTLRKKMQKYGLLNENHRGANS